MLTTLLTALTLASPAPVPLASLASTRFGELAGAFKRSGPLSASVSVWMSGRCYLLVRPNTASGNILIVASRTMPLNEGPLFEKSVTKAAVFGTGSTGHGAPADYYDTLTQTKIDDLNALLDSNFADDKSPPVEVKDGSLISEDLNYMIRTDIRSDSQYIYARLVHMVSGDDLAYCYFFKIQK